MRRLGAQGAAATRREAGARPRLAGQLLAALATSRHPGRPVVRGRPRGPQGPKTVWLRTLRPGALAELAQEPPRPLGALPPWQPRPGEPWSVREFSRSDQLDPRVRQRLLVMGKAWDRVPGTDLPTVFPQCNARDAAYRLLANPRVTMDDILQPRREAVAERCAWETTVLLVQDTTTLNDSGLKNSTVGLGSLGGKSQGKDGLLVHAGLALGVFWLRPWARLEELKDLAGGQKAESERWLEGFEQAVELVRACPRTRVITVCDRAGDIFSLFQRQAAEPGAAGLLVRANRARQRQVLLAKGRAAGSTRGRSARRARRCASIKSSLRAPDRRGAPVTVQAVLVSEPAPPAGRKPLDWLLLSSDGQATAEDVLRTVARYERRRPASRSRRWRSKC